MDGQLFKDPQFLQIMLGTLGSALSAREPTSWQHQLGGAATQLGAGAKMAKSMEARRAEERARWEKLFKALSGGEGESRASEGLGGLEMSPLLGMGTSHEIRPQPGGTEMMPLLGGRSNIATRYLGGYGM